MKYLSHYVEEKQTKLFEECGAWFAFSNEQFAKGKGDYEGTVVSCGAGLYCPESTVKALVAGLERITQEGIAEDLKENGVKGVILRELDNHEAGYTMSIEETVDALRDYGIEEHEVQEVFDEAVKGGRYANW